MKPKQKGHFYSSDRPISSKKQDVLGRAKFAEQLANDLHKWDGKDSLVVGLYGDWGSGKTSVKNMLLEANRLKQITQLPVIEFNPWQFSGLGEISTSFFRELGIVLGKEGSKGDIKKRIQLLKSYSSLLTLTGTVTKSIASLRTLMGKPDGVALDTISGGMTAAGAVVKKGAEALKDKEKFEAKSLHELKREMSTSLAKLPRPILVVIDDIDRLTTEEILQVFQLVKANADFPRVIYLLLFERDVVAKALNKISGEKGNEFLDKIVQVGHHVPHASRTAVRKILFRGLDSHLESNNISKLWDKNRWPSLYQDGIAPYFRNLRHVYRFLASFAFHVRHHRTAQSFEVNPVDLIGLEAIRVFEPGVYESLPAAKAMLTRHRERHSFALEGIKQETIDEVLNQIVSRASVENRNAVRSLLCNLFPPITVQYNDKNGVAYSLQKWLRELRICHPDLFDKYFTLTIAEDDISQAELDSLIQVSGDSNKFALACEALKRRNLLKIAFERLDAYKEQIPLQNMRSLVQALCDMSDTFPERQPGFLELDVSTYAWRMVYFRLKLESDTKVRLQILKDAFLTSTGLALAVQIVSHDERNNERNQQGHEYLLEENELEELKNICLTKLRDASKNPHFRQNPRLHIFLWRWSEWATVAEVSKWIGLNIKSAKDALWLLAVFVQEVHSWGHTHLVRSYIQLDTIERFTDVQKLRELLEDTGNVGLSKKEAAALHEFKTALKRRAEGKPDNGWQQEKEGFKEAD